MDHDPSAKHLSGFMIWLRGVGMGAADIVPGFSGGTVALITGIYERLVVAISRFDTRLWVLLKEQKWREASAHIDFRFVLWLILGIGCGLVTSLFTIKTMLDMPTLRPFVLAAFIGMVFGSSWFVWSEIRKVGPIQFPQVVLVGIGIVIAVTLSRLPSPAQANGEPAYWFLFCCGAIAICAMILPGISGALMLVVLGVYEYLTGTAKSLLKFENLGRDLMICVVFGLGCVVGLLSFSRVLRWLFAHHPSETLSVMLGLMLGAVVKLWPFSMPEHRVGETLTKAVEVIEITPTLQVGVSLTVLAFALLTVATTYVGQRKRKLLD